MALPNFNALAYFYLLFPLGDPTIMFVLFLILSLLSSAFPFRALPIKSRMVSSKLSDVSSWQSILTAVEVAEKPDDYVYGAVNAPGWVLPLGAVLVIATAAIPILLRPGESALEQQRRNEEETGTTFNKRKNEDLR